MTAEATPGGVHKPKDGAEYPGLPRPTRPLRIEALAGGLFRYSFCGHISGLIAGLRLTGHRSRISEVGRLKSCRADGMQQQCRRLCLSVANQQFSPNF
jgi:hypothetical protein